MSEIAKTDGLKTYATTPIVGFLTWWLVQVMNHAGYQLTAEQQLALGVSVMGAHTYLMRSLSSGAPLAGLKAWLGRSAVSEDDVDKIVKKMAPLIVRAIVYQLERRDGKP